MLAAGYHDSPDEALTYIRATAPEGWEEHELPRWRAFVENAPRMLRFLEDHTPLRFRLIHHPDIFADAPGGREMGRMLVPSLIRLAVAGPWRRRIRRSTKPQIFDYDEIMTGDAMVHPVRTMPSPVAETPPAPDHRTGRHGQRPDRWTRSWLPRSWL